MGRWAEAGSGAILLAALAVSLPASVYLTRGARDLQVAVRAPEPHEIAPEPDAALATATAGPPDLLHRLELAGAPDRHDPGIWLRTWQVTYGHRWERQVTLPVLAGPFDPEGKPWPCAVAVRLSPRFFEDPEGGGGDVASVVDRVVRAQFPFDIAGIHFANVAHTRISVRPEAPGLHVSGHVVLADGRRDATELSFDARIALGEHDGDLAARVTSVGLSWRGATRRNPLVALASIFVDVDAQARRVLGERLQGALSIVKLPREPVAVLDGRPHDRFLLRLCDAPQSGPDGLTLRLRVAATLAEPRLDPAVPGPPHLVARPEVGPAPASPPLFEASVSAAGVQQALYVLWQAGELEAWGKREQVAAALRRKLQDRLAFEIGAVSPHLPPVVLPEGDPSSPVANAFRIRIGDVDVGRAGGRRVLADGDLLARGRVAGGSLGLAGEVTDLRVSCVDGKPGAWRLSPCFSDVVPVLRESALTGEGLPLDLPLPERLLRVNLVLGTDLSLHGLVGEVSGSPPMLRLRGEARLTARPVARGKDAP
jgi:hypothetical protein